MTNEEDAIALFDMTLTLAARLDFYSSEAIALLKGRLVNADLEPQQLAPLLQFIDAMRAD